jgi:hypothetical protein
MNDYNHIKFDYKIEGPTMRKQLIWTLQALSDLNFQKINWLSSGHPCSFWSNLDMIYDFIFNDRNLGKIPEAQIGYSIRDQTELDIILPVVKALDEVWNKIGPMKSNDIYWKSSLWQDTVEKAKIAYQYIKDQGKDNECIERIEKIEENKKKEFRNTNIEQQVSSNNSTLFKRFLNKMFGS